MIELQQFARKNKPNLHILSKLQEEMRRLAEERVRPVRMPSGCGSAGELVALATCALMWGPCRACRGSFKPLVAVTSLTLHSRARVLMPTEVPARGALRSRTFCSPATGLSPRLGCRFPCRLHP